MKAKKNLSLWLYGLHSCKMVLQNPNREIRRILALNEEALSKILPKEHWRDFKIEFLDRRKLEDSLPPEAVHQGVAVETSPLPNYPLEYLEDINESNQIVLVLDQLSDPHNVGAILRSAAVFGAKALIMTDRHAPPETGTLAKAASGALELVPIIRIVNLSQAIKQLKNMGFWCVGFAETGSQTLKQIDLKGKIALILGAEGEGMRRLTKELCDFTVHLETSPNFSTLNVSNAAAIALYEAFTKQKAEISVFS